MLLATLLVAEEESPLIDIDGTTLIQLGLFLVALFILSRFLFRPYMKVQEGRKKGIEGARHEAEEMSSRADQTMSEYESKVQRAKLRGAEERQRLRQEGAARERQIVGAARDEAQKAVEGAKAEVGRQASAARTQLEAQAATLAQKMASKVLGREVA